MVWWQAGRMIVRFASPARVDLLLILRVRVVADEGRPPGALVATITTTFDLSEGAAEEATFVGSVDDLIAVVRQWMGGFARGAVGDEAVTAS
jgi:hypothetical protein